jgi:hypothetical protein
MGRKSLELRYMLTLFIILMILKLADVIDWSWWWVTFPLWLPILGVIALGCLVFWFLLLFDN